MADQSKPDPWNVVRARFKWWQRPFIGLEWLTEWFVYQLDRWALVKLLNVLGSFSLMVAAVSYCTGGPARRKAQEDAITAKHYQAWQVINTGEGHGGNGGRAEALEVLSQDGIDLNGVNIQGAPLPGLRLPMGRLRAAIADSSRLEGADLRGADLAKAHLTRARLDGADLRGAILSAATLNEANFTGADLRFADLSHAKLRNAVLNGARLSNATLAGADLYNAEMNGVTWDSTSLSRADLRRAEISAEEVLRGAFIGAANFHGVRLSRRTLSKDSLVTLFRNGGAVFFGADTTWTRFQQRDNSKVRESRAYKVWSEKQESGDRIDIDAEFPRPEQATRPRESRLRAGWRRLWEG